MNYYKVAVSKNVFALQSRCLDAKLVVEKNRLENE